jgi:lantibiotic modifying enzyme
VGSLTGDDELEARAADIIAGLGELPQRRREPDLLSGLAGAVVALLMLRHRVPGAMQRATECADRLLSQATRDGERLCWRSVSRPGESPLTGLSHGAAGIGLAFTELCAVTGATHWADAARQAFAWEDRWFSAEARNWPDFRDVCGAASRFESDVPCRTHWCHGAPGIALSRLRAWQVLGDDQFRARALQALGATYDATLAELNAQTSNFSLCHGLCGNAEILSLGAAAFGAAGNDWAAAALAVAQQGAERHGDSLSWPLGQRGQTPDLLLGLAGIGRFYLRLHAPALPSLLWPHGWLPVAPA